MKGIIQKCDRCGADIEISTYRKYVLCPYCKSEMPFKGFNFLPIDRGSSKYAHVKYEMDCPACRGTNMFRYSHKWRCEDCGYEISRLHKLIDVFWFCDNCDAFLNVQKGFTSKGKKWRCTECGHINSTTSKEIL